ncbi:hypothetical protein [Kitasatospora aureofaciens]|uniref:hypothetical protein n=1 Tax=Kitasatospora aureofaciens TaxID=1894 RepID=UPI000B0F8399|nr:hypothetical protein [Kitasatospora aureofaciens]
MSITDSRRPPEARLLLPACARDGRGARPSAGAEFLEDLLHRVVDGLFHPAAR